MATSNMEQALIAFDHKAWLEAKRRFLDGIDDDVEKTLFDEATVENIFTSVRDNNRDDRSRTRLFTAKIQPLVAAVEDFGSALDSFANIAPIYLAPIWGSIRVILALAKKYQKFYEKIVEVLGQIGDILPRLRDYQRIFDPKKHLRLMMALSNSYLDIILLCTRIRGQLPSQRRSKWARIFQPLSPSANAQLENAMVIFRNHRKTVEKEAETAHMIEEAEARALVERHKKAALRQKLLSYLSILDYEEKQRKTRKLRHPNTGTWLLTSSEYKSWLSSQESSFFCCYGIPGSGKSVLASSIVDELPAITKSAPKIAAIYYYCDYADQRSLDPINIYGSLARALLESIEIPDEIERLIMTSYNDGMRIPEAEEVLLIVQAAMAAHSHVIFVVDGLDETSENDQVLIQTSLRSLLREYLGTLRLFVSCREDVTSLISIPSIPSYKVEIRAMTISDDIADYVTHSIDSLLAKKELVLQNLSLKKEIIEALVEGAKGMFLWVRFVIDDLCDAETDTGIRKILKNLPKDLRETYDRLLKRINSEERRTLIFRIFQWITCAKRPLLVGELQEGIAFDIQDRHWDRDKIPTDMSRIIGACSKLVVVDEESGTVEFAHYTIVQYLLSTKIAPTSFQFHFSLRDANSYVGEVCVTYLCFSDFETQISRYVDTTTANMIEIQNAVVNEQLPSPVVAAMKIWHFLRGYETRISSFDYAKHLPKAKPPTTELLNKYSLLGYVAQNWLLHSASFWQDSAQGCHASMTPLKPMPVTTTQVLDQLQSGWQSHERRRILFQDLVFNKMLMFDFKPWEPFQTSKRYPHIFSIGFALSTNHMPLFASLILQPTAVEPPSAAPHVRNGLDLLSLYIRLASERFYGVAIPVLTNVSREILDRIQGSSDMEEAALGWFYSNLITASRLGHSEILRFCRELLSNKAPCILNHLLIEAAACGQESVVALLCTGEPQQVWFTCSFENSTLNAIERATLGGHMDTVSYLKARGHHPTNSNILTTSTSRAVDQGDFEAFQELLTTAISRAVDRGDIEVFQELLNFNLSGFQGQYADRLQQTMIFAALQNDVTSIVKFMEYGLSAFVSSKHTTMSPFLIAIAQGQYQMVKVIARQAMHNFQDNDLGPPIVWAASIGNLRIFKVLAKSHFPIHLPQQQWPTPLFVAAANGHTEVVQYCLLQNGAPSHLGCPPLHELHENVKHLGVINLDLMFREDRQRQISPLFAAIFNRHVKVISMLLLNGAPIDLQSQEGWNHSDVSFWDSLTTVKSLVAAMSSSQAGTYQSLEIAMSPSQVVAYAHRNLSCAAIAQGSSHRLSILLEAGLTITQEWHSYLWDEAIRYGDTECYKLLEKLEAKADINHAIKAIIHNLPNMLSYMLQNGVCVNTKGPTDPFDLWIPKNAPLLVIAVLAGSADTLTVLLQAGAQVDATDYRGETALMHTISENKIDFFKIICSYYPSFTHTDILGQNAMSQIVELQRAEFIKFTLSYFFEPGRHLPFTFEQLDQASKLYRRMWDTHDGVFKSIYYKLHAQGYFGAEGS